jgi:hypothetical protein
MRAVVAERFRGTRPIAWGDQLTELWLSAGLFRGTFAADVLPGPPDRALDDAVAAGAAGPDRDAAR